LPVRYATKDATRRHKLTAHDRTATAIPLSHLLKRQAYLYPDGVSSQHQNTSQSKPFPYLRPHQRHKFTKEKEETEARNREKTSK
jgi:hypothetical protein